MLPPHTAALSGPLLWTKQEGAGSFSRVASPRMTIGALLDRHRAAAVASPPPRRCCCHCLACATADGRRWRSPLAGAPPRSALPATTALAVFPARQFVPRPPRLPLSPLLLLLLPLLHATRVHYGRPTAGSATPARAIQQPPLRHRACGRGRASRVPAHSVAFQLRRARGTASSTRWAAPPPRPLLAKRRYGNGLPQSHRRGCRRRHHHHPDYRPPGTEGRRRDSPRPAPLYPLFRPPRRCDGLCRALATSCAGLVRVVLQARGLPLDPWGGQREGNSLPDRKFRAPARAVIT